MLGRNRNAREMLSSTRPTWLYRIRHFVAFAASALAIYALVPAEKVFREHHHRDHASRLAQQVLVQAGSLVLLGKRDGESDPQAFAARLLSQAQGNDPRIVHVVPIFEKEGVRTWGLDEYPDLGRWIVRKQTDPEQKSGFEVEVSFGPEFSFGWQSKLGSDATWVCVGVLIFFSFLSIWNSIFGRITAIGVSSAISDEPVESENQPATSRQDRSSPDVLWTQQKSSERHSAAILVLEGMEILKGFSGAARDLIRDAHRIATSIVGTRPLVTQLRDGLHQEMSRLTQAREKMKQTRAATEANEAVLLNLLLEASQMGEKGARLAKMAQSFHAGIRELRESTRQAETALVEFEKMVEPRLVDADQIYHSIEELFESASSMDSAIEGTKTGIVSQSRLLKAIQAELEVTSASEEKSELKRHA